MRCLLEGRLVFELDLRLGLVAKHRGGQIRRETTGEHVVVTDTLDVDRPRRRRLSLDFRELPTQVSEPRVSLQVRIVLGHSQQPRQTASDLLLSLHKGLHLLGGRVGRIRWSDLRRLRPGFDDLGQRLLFEVRFPFDRGNDVRNQVSSLLVHVENARLICTDRFIEPLEVVVTTAAKCQCDEARTKPFQDLHEFCSPSARNERKRVDEADADGCKGIENADRLIVFIDVHRYDPVEHLEENQLNDTGGDHPDDEVHPVHAVVGQRDDGKGETKHGSTHGKGRRLLASLHLGEFVVGRPLLVELSEKRQQSDARACIEQEVGESVKSDVFDHWFTPRSSEGRNASHCP